MSNEKWMEELSKRGNLLYGSIGYISILFEDVIKYVQQPSFDHEKLRDIYTIARVGYRHGSILILTPYEQNQEERIYALCHSSYLKSNEQICHNRVHKTKVNINSIYKFYGSLRIEDNRIILDVHVILNVVNIEQSLQSLKWTSKICCQNYYQYYHSKRMESKINEWWKNVNQEQCINTYLKENTTNNNKERH